MGKKVIRTTESELISAENETMSEIDGKTQARVSNAVKRAKDLNRQSIFSTTIKNRPNNPIVHDDVIARGKDTEQRAINPLLSPFEDITFMFYATTRLGRTTFLTFKVSDIKKLMGRIAILSGEIMYDGEMLSGDIHINFIHERVFYKDKKSRDTYMLETDNRTKKQWDALLEQLKMLKDIEQRVINALLSPYKDTTFMFYTQTLLGLVTFLNFKVQDVKKFKDGIVVLTGEVIFDDGNNLIELIGDININFIRERVFYKDKKSRDTYMLETDITTKEQWDALLEQLKMLLDNRI